MPPKQIEDKERLLIEPTRTRTRIGVLIGPVIDTISNYAKSKKISQTEKNYIVNDCQRHIHKI